MTAAPSPPTPLSPTTRTGALEDVFRLPGGRVDDLRMSLNLRAPERR